MVKNYAWFIDGAGFVPNGNRTYYSSRSQPPFYCFMVDILVREKGLPAVKAVKERNYVGMLEKEYNEFWMKKRAVYVYDPKSDRKVTVNRYLDDYHEKGEHGVTNDARHHNSLYHQCYSLDLNCLLPS